MKRAATDLQYFGWMSESQAVLALTGVSYVRFNFTVGSTHVYIVWKILSFNYNVCNIFWVPATTTKINGKADSLSNIIIVCNQLKKMFEDQLGQLIPTGQI